MNWMSLSITSFLSFHGLMGHRDNRRPNLRLGLTFALMNAYALHRACLWLFKTFKYANLEYSLYNIFTVVNVFNVAFWINEAFFRGQIIRHCCGVMTTTGQHSGRPFSFMDVYQVTIFLLRVSGFVYQVAVAFTFNEESRNHYQADFFYEIPNSIKNLDYFVVILNKGILFYSILILGHFLQALLMYAIQCLRLKAADLARDLSAGSVAVDEISVKHTALFAEVRTMDVLLKWTLFLWLIEWIGSTYDLLMCFAIENSGLRNYRFIPQLYNFISVFSLFVLFFEISLLSGSNSLLLKAFHSRFRYVQGDDERRLSHVEVFLQEKIRTGCLHLTVFETVVINQGSVGALMLGALSYGTYIFSVFSLKNSSTFIYCPDGNSTLNYTNIIS